jgi:predicted double-glycine peptidase
MTPVATVQKGDVIVIVSDNGDQHTVVVSHVEHHIITMTDLPEAPASA